MSLIATRAFGGFLADDDEARADVDLLCELFAPDSAEPIVQEHNSPGMFLVQRVRDEAHRFAITHHRKARSKKALSSPLDSVEGIGPARKRRLLRTFGSLQAIRDASVEELVGAGIPERVAVRLRELL